MVLAEALEESAVGEDAMPALADEGSSEDGGWWQAEEDLLQEILVVQRGRRRWRGTAAHRSRPDVAPGVGSHLLPPPLWLHRHTVDGGVLTAGTPRRPRGEPTLAGRGRLDCRRTAGFSSRFLAREVADVNIRPSSGPDEASWVDPVYCFFSFCDKVIHRWSPKTS